LNSSFELGSNFGTSFRRGAAFGSNFGEQLSGPLWRIALGSRFAQQIRSIPLWATALQRCFGEQFWETTSRHYFGMQFETFCRIIALKKKE